MIGIFVKAVLILKTIKSFQKSAKIILGKLRWLKIGPLAIHNLNLMGLLIPFCFCSIALVSIKKLMGCVKPLFRVAYVAAVAALVVAAALVVVAAVAVASAPF